MSKVDLNEDSSNRSDTETDYNELASYARFTKNTFMYDSVASYH